MPAAPTRVKRLPGAQPIDAARRRGAGRAGRRGLPRRDLADVGIAASGAFRRRSDRSSGPPPAAANAASPVARAGRRPLPIVTFRNRHECKFLVDEAVATRVVRAVQPFTAPDPHGGTRRDPRYPVVSLYLDDARRSLGRETVEGLANRFKLRVRSYGERDRVFLEVKRRHDRVVQKLRCALPPARLAEALAGAPILPTDGGAAAAAALGEFQRLLLLRRARPVAVVRYDREAYVGRGDDEVRVTIDRGLRALATDAAELPGDDARYRPVPLPGVVLELKFTERMPHWMHAAIVANDLRRVSCSKYCRALAAISAADDWIS
jgi:hypothetical protein